MREISIKELNLNPYDKIGKEWMLLTAGGESRGFNTMTCSWGHLGCLWNLPTSVVYVRPQRYTKDFIDREERYTLCFFPKGYKKQLLYLGTKSGRDEDKVAAMGLTPVTEGEITYFAEASLVLICRKLYRAPIREEFFLDQALREEEYPQRDYHDLYIGAIEKILAAD